MNVTLIKNGCKTTSSNGLTATLVNRYKCAGWTCLPKISFCACDHDGTEDELKVLSLDKTLWPWFDPKDSASEEYLGTMVFGVDGLRDSTIKRDVTSTVNGLYASPCQTAQRELIVNGLMFALSERGMAYGRRWEHSRWWGSSCDCHERAVSFRTDCYDTLDTDDGIVELNRVVTVAGPKYTNFRETGKCCDQIMRFEVTLNALDTGFYTKPVCVLESKFDVTQFTCEEWECDEDEHFCGPECCGYCSTNILTGAYDIDQNCCYCRPLMVTRQSAKFDAVATGAEQGFDFEFYSGAVSLQNTRVLIIDGTDEYQDCNFVRSDDRILEAFELNVVPAYSRVRINGKTGSVQFECEGVWVDGSSFVANAGGLPFTNPRITSCKPFSVVFEADAATVAEDAWVKLCVFQRTVA